MTKKVVNTWVNRGRWLTRCPKCRSKTRVKPVGKSEVQKIKWYCGECYPKKIKRVLKMNIDGELTYSYSRKLQMQAAKDAYNADEIYTAILPEDWLEAERLLKMRYTLHQNYLPHEKIPKTGKKETVADLKLENATDPILAYIPAKLKKEKEEELIEEVVVEPKELPPGFYKELQ